MSGAEPAPRPHAWHARLATAALCFQAFFAMTHFGHQLKPEYGAIAALLALLAAGGARWRALAGHPLPWLVLAFTAYAILQAAYAAHVVPAIPFDKQLSANAEPVRVGVFTCVIGAWLADDPRWMPRLLALMVAGFVLAVLVYAPWRDLGAVVDGTLRLRFDEAENIVGEFAAIGLLLVLYALAAPAPRRRGVFAVALAATGALLLACLLYAQSRAAWLAVMLMLPIAFFHLRDGARVSTRRMAAAFALAALAVAGTLYSGHALIVQRFAGGEAIARAVAQRDLAALPHTSAAVRVQLVALGLRAWWAHPVLGNGLQSIAPMIAASGIHIGGYVPPHLHNTYLQAAVGLGGAGAALLAVTFGVLLRELRRARRAGLVDSALYRALLGSLGIVLVVNAFDFLLWRFNHLRAPLELVLGCCFALSLRLRHAATVPPPDAQGKRKSQRVPLG
ncbi:MAG: O-antigen ligase family protein [Mizugakiibacter sp.]|uniref:O-antigen ligase family protein n=1 Tax=Mizugakiibacter sp. TaxID=1972610 RepID=UPI0031BD255B|nr:hypothetical protein [Xanthomonadaceae bacterium]